MTKNKLFIQPDDVLFFRDGRPFDAGGDFTATLNFPPPPSTFYGALRTLIMNFYGNGNIIKNNLNKEIGNTTDETLLFEDSFGSLKITDFCILQKIYSVSKRIFPLPADIVKIKNTEDCIVIKPTIDEEANNNVVFSTTVNTFPLPTFNSKNENIEIVRNYFLTEKGMEDYLQSNSDSTLSLKPSLQQLVNSSEIFQAEKRVGIKKNKVSRTVEEGFIYSSEFARLKNTYSSIDDTETGFYIEIESELLGRDDSKLKIIKIGGENKTAKYEFLDKDVFQPPLPEITNGRFKLITLTPAIFDKGWIPDFIDDNFEYEFNGVKIKLESAIINRFTGVGGWDLLRKTSKPLRRAVPPGSVYYFSVLSGTTEKLINHFQKKSIQSQDYLIKQGFGITIIGVW